MLTGGSTRALSPLRRRLRMGDEKNRILVVLEVASDPRWKNAPDKANVKKIDKAKRMVSYQLQRYTIRLGEDAVLRVVTIGIELAFLRSDHGE